MRKQAGKKQLNRKRNAEGAKGVKKETAVKDSVPVRNDSQRDNGSRAGG